MAVICSLLHGGNVPSGPLPELTQIEDDSRPYIQAEGNCNL